MFFSKQCRRIANHITLPLSFSIEKINHLTTFDTRREKILKIILTVDHNKAHGHRYISVPMLEIGGPSIGGFCVKQVFSDTYKVAYVLVVHKKAIFVQKYVKYLMVSVSS